MMSFLRLKVVVNTLTESCEAGAVVPDDAGDGADDVGVDVAEGDDEEEGKRLEIPRRL